MIIENIDCEKKSTGITIVKGFTSIMNDDVVAFNTIQPMEYGKEDVNLEKVANSGENQKFGGSLSEKQATHQFYTCAEPGCEREFTRKSNLNAHQRMHTDERPYFCETCGIRFRWRSGLNTHKRKVAAGDIACIPSANLVDTKQDNKNDRAVETAKIQRFVQERKKRTENSASRKSAEENKRKKARKSTKEPTGDSHSPDTISDTVTLTKHPILDRASEETLVGSLFRNDQNLHSRNVFATLPRLFGPTTQTETLSSELDLSSLFPTSTAAANTMVSASAPKDDRFPSTFGSRLFLNANTSGSGIQFNAPSVNFNTSIGLHPLGFMSSRDVPGFSSDWNFPREATDATASAIGAPFGGMSTDFGWLRSSTFDVSLRLRSDPSLILPADTNWGPAESQMPVVGEHLSRVLPSHSQFNDNHLQQSTQNQHSRDANPPIPNAWIAAASVARRIQQLGGSHVKDS
uniref:C2H2-type domain-containing protein n=1 Tax=Timspurckia oligopyrenoides TaxID=708627 RepID=A0A7S0ZF97_9RHOD|mmetsp:Transcript_2995/g.5285  ORF Transcript_2995/g.5285 Transcript_2995/m.5285 type:complete len:461 (+) Transcript_2995:164-1546(+)